MPKCKNFDTGTYKGTEPSPKGLGYCAKGEKINKKMKGKDGNMWIINETKTGVRRWVKFTKKSETPKKSKLVKTLKTPKEKAIKKSKLNKKTKRKTKRKEGIIEKYGSMQNYYIEGALYFKNLANNETNKRLKEMYSNDSLYYKILAEGIDKLFKVKIKKNIKDKTYEFTINRKKNYPMYNVVSDIILKSGGANNTEILITNKKVSKEDFKNMQKNNKYIYSIDNVGQNNINLTIFISMKKGYSSLIELQKNYNI